MNLGVWHLSPTFWLFYLHINYDKGNRERERESGRETESHYCHHCFRHQDWRARFVTSQKQCETIWCSQGAQGLELPWPSTKQISLAPLANSAVSLGSSYLWDFWVIFIHLPQSSSKHHFEVLRWKGSCWLSIFHLTLTSRKYKCLSSSWIFGLFHLTSDPTMKHFQSHATYMLNWGEWGAPWQDENAVVRLEHEILLAVQLGSTNPKTIQKASRVSQIPQNISKPISTLKDS